MTATREDGSRRYGVGHEDATEHPGRTLTLPPDYVAGHVTQLRKYRARRSRPDRGHRAHRNTACCVTQAVPDDNPRLWSIALNACAMLAPGADPCSVSAWQPRGRASVVIKGPGQGSATPVLTGNCAGTLAKPCRRLPGNRAKATKYTPHTDVGGSALGCHLPEGCTATTAELIELLIHCNSRAPIADTCPEAVELIEGGRT